MDGVYVITKESIEESTNLLIQETDESVKESMALIVFIQYLRNLTGEIKICDGVLDGIIQDTEKVKYLYGEADAHSGKISSVYTRASKPLKLKIHSIGVLLILEGIKVIFYKSSKNEFSNLVRIALNKIPEEVIIRTRFNSNINTWKINTISTSDSQVIKVKESYFPGVYKKDNKDYSVIYAKSTLVNKKIYFDFHDKKLKKLRIQTGFKQDGRKIEAVLRYKNGQIKQQIVVFQDNYLYEYSEEGRFLILEHILHGNDRLLIYLELEHVHKDSRLAFEFEVHPGNINDLNIKLS